MSLFVLEIGTEELPARFLAPLTGELHASFAQALQEADLSYDCLEVENTPRRTVMHVQGLADKQPLREELALGPALKAAYDAEGKPTKAALGFARGQGVDVADLFTEETEKGVYVAIRKQVGGAAAADVLPAICARVISGLSFPKRMRWGDGDFAFARPIRWILALLDSAIINFTVGKVKSGRETWGHRVHGPGPFKVKQAADLASVLANKCKVVVSGNERRSIIREQGDARAEAAMGRVLWKDSLLDEVVGLTEYPVPLVGNFHADFLDLPREVLLTSMETHQKSFGVETGEGRLLPHFLTILNLQPEDIDVVKKGWERVLRARLEDARFYWQTDLKAGFDVWQKKLDNVVFLGPLGSMGDKCRRLEQLCAWLAEHPGVTRVCDPDATLAAQAGRLAKADLVTAMVGEFDTLQGIMGGIYARHMGMALKVANALAGQYLPSGPDSPVPPTNIGALLSMADKADTMVGCFGLGNIPTGAADPYALRRAALGIARILLEKGYRVPVRELFAKALSLYNKDIAWKLPREESLDKLTAFFEARLKNLFLTHGEDTLLVEAVLGAGHDDVWSVGQRLEALKAVASGDDFAATAQTFKRVANILRKNEEPLNGVWQDDLFQADEEHNLGVVMGELSARFDELWAQDEFGEALSLLADIRPVVDAFFEAVMVMDENPKVRRNRLNLLRALLDKMEKVADFAALQM